MVDPNIGNYKGVMLCNRPNEDLPSSNKPRAFISRVDPKEPLGFTLPAKECEQSNKPKPKTILARHKKWLNLVQKERNEELEEQDRNNEAHANRRTKFEESMQNERQMLLNTEDKVERAKLVAPEEPVFVDLKTRDLIENFDKIQKPKWAMTEEEVEKKEDKEAEELVSFFENLDYDEYIDDLEFRLAMEIVKEKVHKIILEKPELEQKLKARSPPRKTEKAQIRANKRTEHNESWNDDQQKKYSSLAKKIADKILKENPMFKFVHSNASIRQMMDKKIEEKVYNPVVSLVKETQMRSQQLDPSNLPYLHRNPAV